MSDKFCYPKSNLKLLAGAQKHVQAPEREAKLLRQTQQREVGVTPGTAPALPL